MPDTLAQACRQGDAIALARVLRRGGSKLDEAVVADADDVPMTPLLLSVVFGTSECMALLVAHRADLNGVSGVQSGTALHVCCTRGYVDAARLLIDAGAAIGPSDGLGRSPLLMSCLSDQPGCAELLLGAKADCEQAMTTHNPGATPLYAAALTGSTRCVGLLCEAGANINAPTRDGATPLMVSCQEGHLQTSMLLSSYGATRPSAGFKGFNPVHGSWPDDLAVRSGNQELVRWLNESAAFCPLHHLEVLTPQRTLALLRSGRFSPVAGGECAAERARKHPSSEAASLILRASAPWSPAQHELWGWQHRAFAFELLKIGYRLRSKLGDAMLDVWLAHVMPHAVTWDLGAEEEDVCPMIVDITPTKSVESLGSCSV